MPDYQKSKIPVSRKPRNGGAKGIRKRMPVKGKGVHPFIFFIWEQMNIDLWSQEDVAKRAGVASSTMRKWRDGGRNPRIAELEAVLGALGYHLVIKSNEY